MLSLVTPRPTVGGVIRKIITRFPELPASDIIDFVRQSIVVTPPDDLRSEIARSADYVDEEKAMGLAKQASSR